MMNLYSIKLSHRLAARLTSHRLLSYRRSSRCLDSPYPRSPLKDGGGKRKRKAEVQGKRKRKAEIGSPSNQQKRRKEKIKEATIKEKVPKPATGPSSEASAQSVTYIKSSERGYVNEAEWESGLARSLSFLIQQGKVSWDQLAADRPSIMFDKVLALIFLDLPVDMKIQIVNSYRSSLD